MKTVKAAPKVFKNEDGEEVFVCPRCRELSRAGLMNRENGLCDECDGPNEYEFYLEAELSRAKNGLADALRDLGNRAQQDAERVGRGERPWYSAGQYTRDSADLTVKHVEMQAAADALRKYRGFKKMEGK